MEPAGGNLLAVVGVAANFAILDSGCTNPCLGNAERGLPFAAASRPIHRLDAHASGVPGG